MFETPILIYEAQSWFYG